jgi:hypothetical protein
MTLSERQLVEYWLAILMFIILIPSHQTPAEIHHIRPWLSSFTFFPFITISPVIGHFVLWLVISSLKQLNLHRKFFSGSIKKNLLRRKLLFQNINYPCTYVEWHGGPLYGWGKNPWYQLVRRLGGLQSHFGYFAEETDLCRSLKFRSSSQVTVLTMLSCLCQIPIKKM